MNSSSNILIFDTETIGLPKFKKNFNKNKDANPFNDYHNPNQFSFYDPSRLIEIGYQIYTPDRILITSKSMLVKPDNFIIRNTDIHGIEHDYAMANGRPISEVLTDFSQDIASCNTVVAHNLAFDYNILISECYRLKDNLSIAQHIINKFNSMNKFCTMFDTMRIMNLTKRPKLSILYQDLFKKEWVQNHRAEDDAKVCAECYWKLQDIQKINYENILKT